MAQLKQHGTGVGKRKKERDAISLSDEFQGLWDSGGLADRKTNASRLALRSKTWISPGRFLTRKRT